MPPRALWLLHDSFVRKGFKREGQRLVGGGGGWSGGLEWRGSFSGDIGGASMRGHQRGREGEGRGEGGSERRGTGWRTGWWWY